MSEKIRAWVLNPSAPNDVVIEEAETGRHVLKDYGVYEGMSIDDSDQGVAVACVTHCAGFTTEQVEAVSMREMVGAIRELDEAQADFITLDGPFRLQLKGAARAAAKRKAAKRLADAQRAVRAILAKLESAG